MNSSGSDLPNGERNERPTHSRQQENIAETPSSPDDNRCCNREVNIHCGQLNNLTEPGSHVEKVNNNASSSKMCSGCQNGPSTSRMCSDEAESIWNNVNSPGSIDKCLSKVRNGSIDSVSRRRCRQPLCYDKDDESSSGNEGDEDRYVYMYKGSLHADLPNSFFTLGRIANGLDRPPDDPAGDQNNVPRSRSNAGSSPDNEFLEMDFDPGPSLELDGSEREENERESPVPELPRENLEENDLSAENENVDNSGFVNNVSETDQLPGPSTGCGSQRPALSLPTSTSNALHKNWAARESWGHHCSSGDLCSPWETSGNAAFWSASHLGVANDGTGDTKTDNLFSTLYHSIMAKRLVMEKNASFADVPKGDSNDDSCMDEDSDEVERTMIWSEQEACDKQVTQISTSACGCTAIINVMIALNLAFSLEKVKNGVSTRLRQESAPLPQYLFSRSNAGATHEDLIRGIELASDGLLYARFFHMCPERKFSLSKWLSFWIKKGAVPIVTLNLQAGLSPGAPVPDAWHHQMVFGVNPRGVYLTNPLECVPESALLGQLCSPSVLKVKRNDVLQRWTNTTDLSPLMCQTDVRWRKLNVLGQVVNMVREATGNAASSQGRALTSHVTIPADYLSGVTLVIAKTAPAFEQLKASPELPLLDPALYF